jgi:lysozyme
MNIYDQLVREEGKVLHVYPDSEGYLTIGVGHLVDKRLGGQIPDSIAMELLQLDVAAAKDDISTFLPWTDILDEPRMAVVIQMRFMLGMPRLLKFQRTLKAIKEGRYDDAAEHLLDSEMARRQKELAGDRETRCERMARQLRMGVWV